MKTEYAAMFDAAGQKPAASQPIAGLTSAVHGQVTGQAMEPQILRKKRSAVRPSSSSCAKEFVLLGQQGKFSANIPYKLPVTKPLKQEHNSKKPDIPDKPDNILPAAPQTKFDAGKPTAKRTSKTASPKKIRKEKVKKGRESRSKTSTSNVSQKVVDAGSQAAENENTNNNNNISNQKNAEENCSREDKPPRDKNAAKTIDKDLEHVLKYRAGLVSQRGSSGVKRSEYQKMFKWKRCEKPTPVLAASQVIYNSNTEMQPSPRQVRVSTTTEYHSQYKSWLHPPQTRVRALPTDPNSNNNNNNSEDLDLEGSLEEPEVAAEVSAKPCSAKLSNQLAEDANSQRPAGLPSKTVHEQLPKAAVELSTRPVSRQVVESPDSPVKIAEPRRSDWASEYLANFQPFTNFFSAKGMSESDIHSSKKADKNEPGVSKTEDCKVKGYVGYSNWFAEVRELREKAEEYRKRARGMHFSREHVGQLLAAQAKLWDNTSVADSLPEEVLPDKQSDSADKSTPLSSASQHQPLDALTKQAGTHRLAWSHDGSRSTSESDTVRSIRSGHSDDMLPELSVTKDGKYEQVEPKRDNSAELEDKRSSSYVPATQITRLTPLIDRCDCDSAGSPPVPAEESMKKDAVLVPSYSTSPVAGKPTDDTHDLLDDTADNDDVLLSKYFTSPSKKRNSPAGMKPLIEGAADTYKVPMQRLNSSGGKRAANREDRDLSRATSRSSSVLSLASTTSAAARELLDKAEKRRTEFWATRPEPSRR